MNINIEQEIDETELYLNTGEQSEITPTIMEIVSDIQGTTLEKIQSIFDKGKEILERKSEFNEEIFRRRTADQILKDRYITGCTDAGILFVTIARASGIPTKYVETVKKDWLEQENLSLSISGHVYDKENKKWIWVDPMNMEINNSPENKDYVVVAKGLDSWDLGIDSFEKLHQFLKEFKNSQDKNNLA